MALLSEITRLVHIKQDGTEHHFMRGGEIFIPNQFQTLPYNQKGRIEFDTVPDGVYRIDDLRYHSDVTQWVIFSNENGVTYTRDMKMCLTWSIPRELHTPYGQFGRYSPFRVVHDGVETIFTAWSAVQQYLTKNNIVSAVIYDGYQACMEYKA